LSSADRRRLSWCLPVAIFPSTCWRRIEKCGRPRYYLDLLRERKAQAQGQSAYTPAISVIQGLKAALDLILKMGVDNLVANATLQAGAARAAIKCWGMQIFPRVSGNAVTAFVPPTGVIHQGNENDADRFGV
jgi:aspartate aminotransferase-like enzyme